MKIDFCKIGFEQYCAIVDDKYEYYLHRNEGIKFRAENESVSLFLVKETKLEAFKEIFIRYCKDNIFVKEVVETITI